MRKTKFYTVFAALVLAVVSALVAVTSVLSAQQQTVSSSLQVTYQANNVKATVSVTGKTQSGSYGDIVSTTFAPSDSEHSSTNSNLVTLAVSEVTLGGFVPNTSAGVFQRYAVYKFSFANTYESNHGTAMAVTMKYTAPTGDNFKNVSLLWMSAQNSTEPTPEISGTAWSTGGLNVPTNGTSFNLFTGDNRVPQNTTYYLYLFVLVADVTLSSSFVLTNEALTFTLNGN